MSIRTPFYYGWVQVLIASMAMVATLPGIPQGMGIITEPLLADLNIDRIYLARIVLWATLIGALFCIPVGKLIDRFGVRAVLTLVAAAMGSTLVAMSYVTDKTGLWACIILACGFGHGALAVVSISIVGKWFNKRLTKAMGVYAVLVVIGFIVAFVSLGYGIRNSTWRETWRTLGYSIFALAPLAWLLVRSSPAAMNIPTDGETTLEKNVSGVDLRTALQAPAFWLFALTSAFFGFASSGISIFDQSILKERGFEIEVYHTVLTIQTFAGLVASFVGGWLGTRFALSRQMALAMGALAFTLVLLPNLTSMSLVITYASMMGVAGGLVTVIFFAAWSQVFGRAHLGVIQGVAQGVCVVTSAFGPLVLAAIQKQTGSYVSALYGMALIAVAMGLWSYFLRIDDANAEQGEQTSK